MIDVDFDYLGLENYADYQNEEERRMAEEKAENALWDEADDVANPDLDAADLQPFAALSVQSEALEVEDETEEQLERHSVMEAIEAESIEPPPDDETTSGVDAPKKQLKRDVQAAALARLEDSARTVTDNRYRF